MTVVVTIGDILLIIGVIIMLLFVIIGLIIAKITKFLQNKNILKDCYKCKYHKLDDVNSCGDCWYTCEKGHYESEKAEISQTSYLKHCKEYQIEDNNKSDENGEDDE